MGMWHIETCVGLLVPLEPHPPKNVFSKLSFLLSIACFCNSVVAGCFMLIRDDGQRERAGRGDQLQRYLALSDSIRRSDDGMAESGF